MKGGNLAHDFGDIGLVRCAVLPDQFLARMGEIDGAELDRTLLGSLNDPLIEEALFVASPDLHERLLKWRASPDSSHNCRFALANYLLRMSFRATPFGLFVSVGVCNLGGNLTRLVAPERADVRRRVRLDGSATSDLIRKILSDRENARKLTYKPNGTIVRFGSKAHFVSFKITDFGRRIYNLFEFEWSDLLSKILSESMAGSTIDELVNYIAGDELVDGQDENGAEELIWELIDAQILCADDVVRLTDGDMFFSFMESLNDADIIDNALQSLGMGLKDLELHPFVGSVVEYRRLHEALNRIVPHPISRTFQVDLFGKSDLPCELNEKSLNQITLISKVALGLGGDVVVHPRLSSFVERFEERYGDCSVPLLLAIDEVAGIGYGAENGESALLCRGIKFNVKEDDAGKGSVHKVGKFHDVLKNLAFNPAAQGIDANYVELPSVVVDALIDDKDHSRCAGGMAWCSMWRDDSDSDEFVVELKRFTVQPPERVMGRFGIGLPGIANYLRESNSELADEYNSVVAEIVHLPQDRLGNVVSRIGSAEYEISIRAGCRTDVNAIRLDDILVSVQSGKVILFVRSLDKRLLLTMSNAHNFNNEGSLGIYKFLNDVSLQNHTYRPLNLRSLDLSMKFVPGLVFGSNILSRPSWLLNASDLMGLKKLTKNERRELIRKWRKDYAWPDWIALAEGDNVIPIHLDRMWMVDALSKWLCRLTSAIITDVYPRGMKPALRSSVGFHHHEILVPFDFRSSSRERLGKSALEISGANQARIGSNWLYFIIYSHPDQQDDILARLSSVIGDLTGKKIIEGAFFVRYADALGKHIRLRFKVENKISYPRAFSIIASELNRFFDDGIIKDISMATYNREISRYGGEDSCACCEKIFMEDSYTCLRVLQDFNRNSLDYWHVLAVGLDSFLEGVGVLDISGKLKFARGSAGSFSKELGFTSDTRKSIGKIFRSTPLDLSTRENNDRLGPVIDEFCGFNDRIRLVWARLEAIHKHGDEQKMFNIRSSLLHMRMNRLLSKNFRLQEGVAWDLLRRLYEQAVARGFGTLIFR